MKKISTTLLFIALIFFFKPTLITAQVNTQDSLALVDLYNSTDGPHWYGSPNWLTSAPVSTWFGITVTGNRVTQLNLAHDNLNGKIPSSLGNLTELTSLNFSFNHRIYGVIPASFGHLQKLRTLYLQSNKLTNIPSALGDLSNLVDLELDDNRITGSIPSSLGNISGLLYLSAAGNRLTGSIPAELGNLSNLRVLSLAVNQLSGSIPSSFGNLTGLITLYLLGNQLSGDIPAELGNLKNLNELLLYDNYLSGKIPKELGNCTNLGSLDLSGNQLTGKIPATLNSLVKLQELDLSVNYLSGLIPTLDSLKNLHDINLRVNKFTFSGMEKLVTAFPFASYFPQTNIKLHRNGNALSVFAGGANALPDNTYRWYKNGVLYKTKVGDSSIVIKTDGAYNVTVTNSVATQLTLYSDTLNYVAGENLIASQINNKISFISIYPNPAKTNAILSFNANRKYAITITDVSGKSLQTKTGVAVNGINNIQLDVSKFASGIYLITIVDEKNRKQTVKLNKE